MAPRWAAGLGDGRIAGGRTYDGGSWDDLPPVGDAVEGTVQLWFRARPVLTGDDLHMIFHGSPVPGANGYGNGDSELYLAIRSLTEPDLHFRSYHQDGGATIQLNAASPSWMYDQWHHITSTWSEADSRAVLYVDGAAVGTDDSPPMMFAMSSFLRLGGNWEDPARSFDGELDEVRFYSTAFDSLRVTTEFAAQAPDFAVVGGPEPID